MDGGGGVGGGGRSGSESKTSSMGGVQIFFATAHSKIIFTQSITQKSER